MRKDFLVYLKRGAAVALSVAMLLPSMNALSVNALADEAALIKEYDFEKGFREFKDNDSAYKIISAGGQMIKKTPEQMESGDRVDANGFVIMGEDAKVRYITQSPGNQPSVKYDSEKGTVFFLAGTSDVPELVKEVSGVVSDDPAAAKYLDEQIPVGTVVREAATFKCAMTFTNPFKKLSEDEAVLSFWGKVPSDSTDEKIAFMEFENGSTVVNFCYDNNIERGSWHYYTYLITKDSVNAYVDGNASELSAVVDGTAPENMIEFLKNANIYFGATDTSSLRTVEETVFDDVRFYNGSMSAEEVKALYDSEYSEWKKGVDIDNPLSFIALDSTDSFENINADNPSAVEEFNINGHKVLGTSVVENTKGDTKNGIKIKSPFAGLRLEGATIGYWIQVEPRAKVIDKNTTNSTDPKKYTGNYPGAYVINETNSLSFMDTKKMIQNPKHGTEEEGFSYLLTSTRMQALFEEGGYFGMNTGNLFEIDSSDEDAKKYVDESRNWHYITLVISNDGIVYYYDGAKVNGLYTNSSPRFLDGYYRRVAERSKASTLYGIFGGSGNQTTTQLMSFLTYEDTDMYFGWCPTSDFRNELSNPINISRMSCYGDCMNADEVSALYNKELAAINELPVYEEEADYILGDVNADEVVSAEDALIVLKVAAKLTENTDDYMMRGDMNEDGLLDASDALTILKIAAKLI